MKKIVPILLALTLTFPIHVFAAEIPLKDADTSASETGQMIDADAIPHLSEATVSNIALPSPGMSVSDYIDTTKAESTEYSVMNKECYWSQENKTQMLSTNVFSEGSIYYYTIVLRANGDYVFNSDATLKINGGVVDPGTQVTIINAGKEIKYICAYKITLGVGQVKTIGSVELNKDKFYYNGKVHKPSVVVYDNIGTKIDSGYKVEYGSGCKKVGVYTVTVEPNGNTLVGSASTTFTICPSAPRSVRAGGQRGAVKVSWKKPKSGKPTAYDVFVYSDSAGKKLVTSATITGTKKVIGGLKSATYYVKVDCYTQSDQGYLVSKQTAAKMVSVK